VPKTGSRRFENLLRAFGVVGAGAGDELRFPLTGAVSPIIRADDYDPAPIFGISVSSPLVAGQFGWVEVRANPWARIVAFTGPATVEVTRRSSFTAGGTPVAAPYRFSSTGELGRATVQTGSTVAPTGGVFLGATTVWPVSTPIHWEGVLHFEGILAALALPFNLFFQEQRAV
jgi:hypothetical protein